MKDIEARSKWFGVSIDWTGFDVGLLNLSTQMGHQALSTCTRQERELIRRDDLEHVKGNRNAKGCLIDIQ